MTTRTVEGILHFLTPQQMAEEIGRLDALLEAAQTNAYAEGRKDERDELQGVLGQAREALEMARTGLDWYRGMLPEYVDGSDGEADTEIEGAIASIDAALATAKGAAA